MHVTQCLLGTGVELNLVNKTLVLRLLKQQIQQRSLPKPQTATKQPLQAETKVLPPIHCGSLCARAWSGVVHKLAANIFHRISLMYHFLAVYFHSLNENLPQRKLVDRKGAKKNVGGKFADGQLLGKSFMVRLYVWHT